LSIAGGGATILAYAILIPRPVPTISEPVNIEDPFSSSVTITNNGFITLDRASLGISPKEIVAESGQRIEAPEGASIVQGGWQPQDLGMDKSFTYAMNDIFMLGKNRLDSAEIEIVVSYEIPIIHLRRQERFPWYARKQTNGNFYWYSGQMPK
jgi:hypothetical protein